MKTANKTWYLDENRQLTDDEEKAAFVLINEGQEIPPEMEKEYFSKKAKTEDAEGEKASSPTSNKAATPTKNKGAR